MKAIIFDMDGVIVDSEPVHFKVERELLEELGGSITDEEHEEFVGTTDYHMWSTFKEKFNLQASVEEMMDKKRSRFIENIEEIELIPNFLEFIEGVLEKEYKLALASSNNKKAVGKIVEFFELEKYFDFIISGEEVEKGKPNPEIFLTAAEKLDVNPENCLVIEDAETGVEAAKSANMKCIGFKARSDSKQDLSKADLVVGDYKELELENLEKLF